MKIVKRITFAVDALFAVIAPLFAWAYFYEGQTIWGWLWTALSVAFVLTFALDLFLSRIIAHLERSIAAKQQAEDGS